MNYMTSTEAAAVESLEAKHGKFLALSVNAMGRFFIFEGDILNDSDIDAAVVAL